MRHGKQRVVVEKDDHLFPRTTLEGFAKLRPACGPDSSVAAGNASGIVDGVAALIVAMADRTHAAGRHPLGFVRAWVVVGHGRGPRAFLRPRPVRTATGLSSHLRM